MCGSSSRCRFAAVGERAAVAAEPPAVEALRGQYLRCLLAPDGRRARTLLAEALTVGTLASTLYLRVIAPAMHEIGRLWETAQISVAQEHLSTQITQVATARLGIHLHPGDPVGAGRVALVSSSPGEMHALGTQMVADIQPGSGNGVPIWGLSQLTALEAEYKRRGLAIPGAAPPAPPGGP